MKKRFIILSVLMVLVLSFCFGCGKNDIAGTYKLEKIYDASTSKICEIGDKYDGKELTSDMYVVIVHDDHTVTVKRTNDGETVETTGIWTPVPLGEDIYGFETKYLSGTVIVDGDTLIVDRTDTMFFKKV